MTTVLLSVRGSDRPGLTEALAEAVLSAGGNWLEGHLSRLGGLYVGSVLVALEAGRLGELQAAVQRVDAQGLEVRLAPVSATPDAVGELVNLSLVGRDQPGIVRQVTRALRGLEVNIETFETTLSTAPHSGADLFHLEARLRLPRGCSAEAVQAALEAISTEIMVDIVLTPRPG